MRALSPVLLAHAPWGALAPVLGSAFAWAPPRRAQVRVGSTVIADIVPLVLGEFRFAADEPNAGEAGVVVAYAVRHRGGVLLFDTGFGFGNDELDAYYRIQARRVPDALAEAGISMDDVTSVVNCHLHVDHAGQNGLFPGIPIYVQPAEWEIAHTTDHTILEWIDFPGADYRPIAGDHEPADGIRVVATPSTPSDINRSSWPPPRARSSWPARLSTRRASGSVTRLPARVDRAPRSRRPTTGRSPACERWTRPRSGSGMTAGRGPGPPPKPGILPEPC